MMNDVQTFKITDAHLKLLRRMCVDWSDVEYGAPEIDPKRPYGTSDVTNDILEIIGIPAPKNDNDEIPEALSDFARKLHENMETVLQICLSTQTFEQGEYIKTDRYDSRAWKKKKV